MKPGELRTLTDAQLVVVGARCALRTEPWLSTIKDRANKAAATKAWRAGVATLVNARSASAKKQARDIQNVSARVANGGADEAGYALLTLSCACALAGDADPAIDRKKRVKALIDIGKYAASIAAMCAHAGRVKASDVEGKDLVDGAVTLVWNAARADVDALVAGKTFASLDAKLWPKKPPRFWPHS